MKGSTVFRSKTSEKKKHAIPCQTSKKKKNTGCIRCIITQQG